VKSNSSIFLVITAYIGIAILLFASFVMLEFSIPYVTASEYARQQNWFEWTGVALLFAFFIAVLGSFIALICEMILRNRHLRISLIIGGLIYILSCLPLQIFDIKQSGPGFLIITFFCLLPGIGCVVGGIKFHKHPPKKETITIIN
jgi:hypothetical protein